MPRPAGKRVHFGGGTPPGGVKKGPKKGQKGAKKGQKVAIQGGTLGLPSGLDKNPRKKWGFLTWLARFWGPRGHFWGGTPPWGAFLGGEPPPPGGISAPPGLFRGGVPPLGGPRGVQKGPKKGHFRPKNGVFPQLRVYGKKSAKKRHFIGVLRTFRPKI